MNLVAVDTTSNNTSVGAQAPINADGEVNVRPVLFADAFNNYKDLVRDNKARTLKNAAISRKLNGDQPWDARKLKAAGQSWRSNRPTGFMATLLARVLPPYKQVIDQLQLLTFASFSKDSNLGSPAQQDVFRQAITNTIREWPGWGDFVTRTVREVVGFGFGAVCPRDAYDWRPVLMRSDDAFFADGCPMTASEVKLWACREDLFLDDMLKVFKRGDDARDAGWQLDSLRTKLAGGGENQTQVSGNSAEEDARREEDKIRRNSESPSAVVKVLKVAHLWMVNHLGGLDHYIFDRNDGTPLFFQRNPSAKIEHSLALLSAEEGDGSLQSSRGVLRNLYNTHVAVEQSRNLIHDALHLSGLLLVRRRSRAAGSGIGDRDNISLSVMHPFAILDENFEVLEGVNFSVNADAFEMLDRHATNQAEIQVGAFMPGQSGQEKSSRTASEVNYVASIDAQIRAGVLARFADQFFNIIANIQRSICSVDNIKAAQMIIGVIQQGRQPVYDLSLAESLSQLEQTGDETWQFVELPSHVDAEAVKCLVGMMRDGLTPLQILALAASSPRASIEDVIASQSGALELVVRRYAMDTKADTVELMRRDISSKLGASAAERLMNVELSPLSAVKQQRQQIGELTDLMSGANVPVDPTDDALIHLSVIADRLVGFLPRPDQDVSALPLQSVSVGLQAVVKHAQEHINLAASQGVKLDAIKDVLEVINQTQAFLMKFADQPALDQQAADNVSALHSRSIQPAISAATDSNAATKPAALQSSLQFSHATPATAVAAAAAPPRPTPTGA